MADQTILVVEDDARVSALLRNVLEEEGFAVREAASRAEVLNIIATVRIDLITLDIHLGADNGLEVARDIRRYSRVPIVMVTGKDDVSDRVVGLELGADDYITKPFDFAELEARARAVMRRLGGAADNKKEFAGLIFDSNAGTISAGGRSEQLRNREMRLLEVFFAAPGQIFSKSHLMDRLFSFSDDVSENAIEVYVGRLRRKLGETQAHIETVRGLGYRMVKRE